jgi:hypothetical protein
VNGKVWAPAAPTLESWRHDLTFDKNGEAWSGGKYLAPLDASARMESH